MQPWPVPLKPIQHGIQRHCASNLPSLFKLPGMYIRNMGSIFLSAQARMMLAGKPMMERIVVDTAGGFTGQLAANWSIPWSKDWTACRSKK
jgi:hypothetical protein